MHATNVSIVLFLLFFIDWGNDDNYSEASTIKAITNPEKFYLLCLPKYEYDAVSDNVKKVNFWCV